MTSFDTNILFYSLNPQAKWHEAARTVLIQSLHAERVVICDYVLTELYNLLRNPAVMSKPLSPSAATNVINSYLKHPKVTRAENAPIMDQVWELAAQPRFPRKRIFDLRLGLTLRFHGVTHFMTANVKDFQKLGFEKVWNPLIR